MGNPVELRLFEMSSPLDRVPGETLSVGRQRTLRQHALVALGTHPLARRPTRPELGTCGDCTFRRAGRYPKCTLDVARMSRSIATDCRAWWPACPDHQAKDD